MARHKEPTHPHIHAPARRVRACTYTHTHTTHAHTHTHTHKRARACTHSMLCKHTRRHRRAHKNGNGHTRARTQTSARHVRTPASYMQARTHLRRPASPCSCSAPAPAAQAPAALAPSPSPCPRQARACRRRTLLPPPLLPARAHLRLQHEAQGHEHIPQLLEALQRHARAVRTVGRAAVRSRARLPSGE